MKFTRIIMASSLFFLFAGLIFFSERIEGNKTQEAIMLGYCPTMKTMAEDIASENKGVVLVEKASSAQALFDLQKGNIDIILIGRLAKESEKASSQEKVIGAGYTIISNKKKFVQYSEISQMNIHTAVPEKKAKELLSDATIIFHKTTDEAVENGISDAVLIDWKDYKDEYELIVVMDQNKKSYGFRIPVLYSSDQEKLDKLRL